MDVFCPNCLHSVTLEAREPGEYSFDCPECAQEARVTVPENPAQRPVVRPVRTESSRDDSQAAKSGSSRDSQSARPSNGSRSADRSSTRGAKAIDFPFEASDANLVDADEKPPQDEWESPEYEVPQPLRGAVKQRKSDSQPPRRKSQPETEFGTYLKWMAAGAAVWVVLVVAGLYVRELGWASVAFGVLILLTARGMILRIARKEGVAVWLACLVVPLYSVFFAFAHFRQAANALLLAFFGYGYLVSGFVVFEVHDAIDAVNAMPAAADPDEDDGDDELQKVAAAKVMAGIDSLTLTVDGKQTRVAVNQLTCVEANLRQGAAADAFEFSGPDVSLRGSFPSEFHGEWAALLGKPVKILPRSDQPQPGDSHLKLPGRGLVKVTGGEFVVSGAMTVGQPMLFGAIEVDTGGPQKPETIRGTFLVRVKAAN